MRRRIVLSRVIIMSLSSIVNFITVIPIRSSIIRILIVISISLISIMRISVIMLISIRIIINTSSRVIRMVS